MFEYFKSKGKVNILLDKTNFSAGETIKGKVVLEVKRNFQSKGVKLSLIAINKVTSVNMNKSSSKTQTIYDFSSDLENEQAYSSGVEAKEFNFEVAIPKDVFSLNKTSQNIVNVLGAVAGRYQQTKWYLTVVVRVRKSLLNIKKRVEITVQ